MNEQYHPSPASLFATAARQQPTKILVPPVWTYCVDCNQRKPFQYVRDQGNDEIYACPTCGRMVGFRVR